MYRLPLLKLSSATTKDMHVKPVPWIHQVDPSMSLVIEAVHPGFQHPGVQSNKLMKIFNGDHLVVRFCLCRSGLALPFRSTLCSCLYQEILHIEQMCHASSFALAEAHSRGQTLQHIDYPTAAIVKSPCVALRYTLEHGEVLLVLISSNAQCSQAV